MKPLGESLGDAKALFLSPESPVAGEGGGGLRSASLLEYLRRKYAVEVARFELRQHSKTPAARALRNASRLIRGAPPLFDRYSGYEEQIEARLGEKQWEHGKQFELGIVEHFWCASYAPLLRKHCRTLVLDLHNIESDLARTHARAARWPASWASGRFADAYAKLEQEWLPQFDLVLVTSEDDARSIRHPHIVVYPNALPELPCPGVPEENCIVFSGNLEYHPNIEAVRWFRTEIWPRIRERVPGLEWRLVGKNPEAVMRWTSGDERIRLIGPVADALPEIGRAKVDVVPLLSGSGTRFKILEAWAARRAVVSTTLGAAGLGAADGENVLMRDASESFADAVVQLLGDDARRRALGHAGRELYLDRFTWSAAWACLEGHF